jgi:hypothetical protein
MPRTTPCKDPYRSSLRTARTTRRTQQGGYSSATGTATKAASVCTTSKKLILGVSICLSLAINLVVHHPVWLPVIPTRTNADESRMKYKKRIMPRSVRRPYPRRGHNTSERYYRSLMYAGLCTPGTLHKTICCIGPGLCINAGGELPRIFILSISVNKELWETVELHSYDFVRRKTYCKFYLIGFN